MWNCAYQIYPRTIKVVSILSKFIFLDLKTCFFEKRVSKEISYIVYISAILPNIVYISLVSLKEISLRPDHFDVKEDQTLARPGPDGNKRTNEKINAGWLLRPKSASLR